MSTVTGMRRSNRWVQRALSMRDVETRGVEGEADITDPFSMFVVVLLDWFLTTHLRSPMA